MTTAATTGHAGHLKQILSWSLAGGVEDRISAFDQKIHRCETRSGEIISDATHGHRVAAGGLSIETSLDGSCLSCSCCGRECPLAARV